MKLNFRGIDLDITYRYHPEQFGGAEVEPLKEHVIIDDISWLGVCIDELFLAWCDEDELMYDVLKQHKENQVI